MALHYEGAEYWTYEEAARYLGCTRRTIYNAVRDGRLKPLYRVIPGERHTRFVAASNVRAAGALIPQEEISAESTGDQEDKAGDGEPVPCSYASG